MPFVLVKHGKRLTHTGRPLLFGQTGTTGSIKDSRDTAKDNRDNDKDNRTVNRFVEVHFLSS